jgi:hypothetical protein
MIMLKPGLSMYDSMQILRHETNPMPGELNYLDELEYPKYSFVPVNSNFPLPNHRSNSAFGQKTVDWNLRSGCNYGIQFYLYFDEKHELVYAEMKQLSTD